MASCEKRQIGFERVPLGGLFWSDDGEQWQRVGCTSERQDCAVRLSDYKERSFCGEVVFVNDFIDGGLYCVKQAAEGFVQKGFWLGDDELTRAAGEVAGKGKGNEGALMKGCVQLALL